MVYNAQQPYNFSGLQMAFQNIGQMRQRNKELNAAKEQENQRAEANQRLAQDKAAAEQAEAQRKQQAIQAYAQGNPGPLQQGYPDIFIKMEQDRRQTGEMNAKASQTKAESTARAAAQIAKLRESGATEDQLNYYQAMIDTQAEMGKMDKFDVRSPNLGESAQIMQSMLGAEGKDTTPAMLQNARAYLNATPEEQRTMKEFAKLKQGVVNVGLDLGGQQALTSAQQSAAQGALRENTSYLSRLQSIKDEMDELGGPEVFGNFIEQGSASAAALGTRLGWTPDESKDKALRMRKLRARMQRVYNEEKKRISGASVSQAEKDDLIAALVNPNDSPLDMQAKLEVSLEEAQQAQSQEKQFLREGIDVGQTKKPKQPKQAQQRFNNPDEALRALGDGPEFDAWFKRFQDFSNRVQRAQ